MRNIIIKTDSGCHACDFVDHDWDTGCDVHICRLTNKIVKGDIEAGRFNKYCPMKES